MLPTMNPFYAPLSGDVNQALAAFFKSMSQIGLVNIVHQMQTQHPDLEEKIVREGFSYGQQLGRITDVLQVLVRQVQQSDQTILPGDAKAIEDFTKMADRIDALKAGALTLSAEGIHDFARRMERLKIDNSTLFDDICQRISTLNTELQRLSGK